MSAEAWQSFVNTYHYHGKPEDFEAWVWKALAIPECILSLPSYKPPAARPNGDWPCGYHSCPKVYKTEQSRESQSNFFSFVLPPNYAPRGLIILHRSFSCNALGNSSALSWLQRDPKESKFRSPPQTRQLPHHENLTAVLRMISTSSPFLVNRYPDYTPPSHLVSFEHRNLFCWIFTLSCKNKTHFLFAFFFPYWLPVFR